MSCVVAPVVAPKARGKLNKGQTLVSKIIIQFSIMLQVGKGMSCRVKEILNNN